MRETAETDDGALLGVFAREGSESAFRSLVERHSGWVYAIAFRQLRDAHLAEDATQTVFVLLWQRAKKMKPQQKLSGWLFVTLGYTVRSVLRSRQRRQRHEGLAALERPTPCAPPLLADDLDAAVARLSKSDQIAILLRFYEGLEFASVARRLGISDEAARKRVVRAISRLRERLGAAVTADSLMAASAFGAPAASAALSAHVTNTALSAASGGAIPAGVAPILKGTVYLMAMTKAKITAVIVILSLLMGTGVGIVGWNLLVAPAEPQAPNLPAQPAPIPAAVSIPPQTFEQVYGLHGNEAIRRVAPPFAKARMDFYRKEDAQQALSIPNGPDGMFIFWRGSKPQLRGMTFSGGRGYKVQDLMQYLLGVYPQELEGDARLAGTAIKGDFVINGDANTEQLRAGLEAIITEGAGTPVTLTFRDVERPVIVFKGKWLTTNLNPNPSHTTRQTIELYGAKMGPSRFGGAGSGSVVEFAKWAGKWINNPMIIEASGAPQGLSWHDNDSEDGSPESQKQAHDLTLVCNHIHDQTGLSWTQETRRVRQLFIERGK